jgi:hypothetical protein
MKRRMLLLFTTIAAVAFKAQSNEKLLDQFRKTKNDSIFLSKNPSIPYKLNEAKKFAASYDRFSFPDSVAFAHLPGEIVGPFYAEKTIVYIKITDVDLGVKFRVGNIWLDSTGISADSINKTSLYIFNRAKAGTPFDDLCQKYSGTRGHDKQDCDLGWATQKQWCLNFMMR